MSLHRKIDVEPLTDARVFKIGKAVFERLDDQELSGSMGTLPERRAQSKWVWTARVAVVVGAAAVVILALVSRRMSVPHAVVADNPSRIVTGPTPSHLALGDSSIDVSPDSVLVVNGDDDRGVLLVLERGRMTCDVAPRNGRPPVVVQAGDVRVRVVGTRFTVARVDDSARVEVAHGTVEVTEAGQMSMIHEGQAWGAPSPSARATQDAIVQTDRIGQELFEQASELEKRDPSRAISTYQQVATGSGPWAMNAVFAQGRLESDRGNVAEGRRLLGSYLTRFPHGPNAADARLLLDRTKYWRLAQRGALR